MADEFNLVPTNNLEKHLDNILRTAQGGEPQYDLAPNWRTEQYLAAIESALASGGGGGVQLPVEIVTYTYNGYTSTYECDHTYEDILDAYYSGVPCVAVLKFKDSQSEPWAYANSVAPIRMYYPGERILAINFETISSSSTASATMQKYVKRIEHKSDGSITQKWSKKYTITFDA